MGINQETEQTIDSILREHRRRSLNRLETVEGVKPGSPIYKLEETFWEIRIPAKKDGLGKTAKRLAKLFMTPFDIYDRGAVAVMTAQSQPLGNRLSAAGCMLLKYGVPAYTLYAAVSTIAGSKF